MKTKTETAHKRAEYMRAMGKRRTACLHAIEEIRTRHPDLATRVYSALPPHLRAELDAAYPVPSG